MTKPRIPMLATMLTGQILAACAFGQLEPQPAPVGEAEKPVAAAAPLKGEAAAPVDAKVFALRTTPRLTGDWGGARSDMEKAGIAFDIKVLNEWMVNIHGGRETKNGNDFGGSYDLDLKLDLEKLFDLRGASFLMRAKGTWGAEASDFDSEKIGGIFRTNQDAGIEEPIFVDKWHYAQKLLDDRLEVRIGRLDLLKDLFDLSKVMGNEDNMFLNQALVRNGVIPSNKALGIFAEAKLTELWYVKMAVVDSESRDRQTNFNTAFHGTDHFRVYLESGLNPKFESSRGKMPGSYRLGSWYDPNRKERYFNRGNGTVDPRFESGDYGLYLGFDQMVWKENEDAKDRQGISVAGRYGWADGSVNRLEHFWALAAQYEGLIPQRDKDVLGVGVAQGLISEDFRQHRDPGADRETVLEAYYSWQATPSTTISPTFQFVADPGASHDEQDATVFGLRVKMAL